MIVENENYIIDPVAQAASMYSASMGERYLIEGAKLNDEVLLKRLFKNLDTLLGELDYWLDKVNEEDER